MPNRLESYDESEGLRRRRRCVATVELNRPLCRDHFLLRLRLRPGSLGATEPGQFIQLGCRPPYELSNVKAWLGQTHHWSADEQMRPTQWELVEPLALLRRPFSLAGRGEDARGTWVDVIHRVVGVATRWLANLRSGAKVDLIGPLGNWFTIPSKHADCLLVGGGVGLPPMFYLAESLSRAGHETIAFVGAATRNLLPVTFQGDQDPSPSGQPVMCAIEFSRYGYPTVVTTDDGTCGLSGMITDGLRIHLEQADRENLDRTKIYTCGPEAMMRAVTILAAQHGVDCQVCVEQAMACGLGTCQSCVVKIEDETDPHGTTEDGRPWRYYLTCTQGPVFAAEQVVW